MSFAFKVADKAGCVQDQCLRYRADGKPRSPPQPPCDNCVGVTKSIIEEMKEPDPAMIRAGMCVLEEIRGANHVRRADMELVEAIWRAMVEEALK